MLDLLYEDQHVLVLNKAPGIVVHPGSGVCDKTLVQVLCDMGIVLQGGEDKDRLGVVHRLDRFTEGVMVFAKSSLAYTSLQAQFRDRQVDKRYWAMVKGNVVSDTKTLSLPIGRHRKKRHLFSVRPDGKSAETSFRVEKRWNTKTLLDVQLVTGRTHQIRVHLSAMGHPVLKDPDYGDKRGEGQLLQSYYLSFFHPFLKKKMTFVLPLSRRLL